MPEYRPVPVASAQSIADSFEKDVVVIFTLDHAYSLAHYTTFGRTPHDKLEAAGFGDLIAGTISEGRLGETRVYEDFRLEAAKHKAGRDALLAACESLLADADAKQDDQAAVKRLYEAWRAVRVAVAKAKE